MKITFIGGGNMANAIIGGLRKQGFPMVDIQVVEPVAEQRAKLSQEYGVACKPVLDEPARACDVMLLAVKPQQMGEALKGGITAHSPLIISIMAGVTLTTISRTLDGYLRLVRAMPNTPALIGAGISGYYSALPFNVSDDDIKIAESILKSIGTTVRVEHQEQLDAVTALSGSGPAYVFYFIEALRDAGIELGLPADTANTLAIETFLGAAKLAAQSLDDVKVLRQRVTSRGGTTETALSSMMRDCVREAVIRAVKAANDRGRELGRDLEKR